MEKRTLIENDSLKNILNAINARLIDFEDEEISNIEITSPDKPEFIIKIAEINISNTIMKLKPVAEKIATIIEIDYHDFFVYHIVEEGPDKVLMIISLFELILADFILSDNNNNSLSQGWSLDSKNWNLKIN